MSNRFLEHTVTFHAVVAAGSLRRGARALGVSVSTVSRTLDQLEAHLGTRLVHRGGQQATATENGRLYLERTRPALDALRDGEDAIREALAHPAGRLVVAAPVELVRGVVGRAALAYLAAYPDVRLEVLGTDQDLLPDGEDLHVVVAISRTLPPDGIVRRALRPTPMRLCASPTWVATHGPMEHPSELAARRCVVLGSGPQATTVPFTGPEGPFTVQVGAALFTTSVALARRAALEGVGPTGLPAQTCAGDLAEGRLVELLPGWTLLDVPCVAYLAHRRPPLPVRAFLDVLDQHLAADGPVRSSAGASRTGA